MNQTSPAIVAQSAVRRFPRPVLLVFCLAYVLAGFVGREAWKSADMAALGFMHALARGASDWWNPTLAGFAPEQPALLPYWLGAWAILARPAGMAFDFAARIPFGLLLGLSMVGTWYGTYYLARSPWAQPVAFAFGGEAQATDYARTVADGGVLAFMACLGLAHLSHETTPALAQLGFTALLFFAIAALPYRPYQASTALVVGASGLALSGAPAVTLLLCSGAALLHALDRSPTQHPNPLAKSPRLQAALVLSVGLASAALAHGLHLWKWKISIGTRWEEWRGLGELLVWFSWPAWPLVLWTLWHWRHRLLGANPNRHLLLPLWFAAVTVGSSLLTGASDRTLLLALPALAALAAFSLPTLKRQVAALVDWFTLFFFSGCGIIIWVVWIAMHTGVPSQPAANVARLAPDFQPSFSFAAFSIALCATLVWGWLVHWRVGRHRAALWKSLVLPAGGAGWCWLLLMTLWMPLLDHAQSYTTLVAQVRKATATTSPDAGCIAAAYVPQGTLAALVSYGGLDVRPLGRAPACPWLLTEAGEGQGAPQQIDTQNWGEAKRIANAVGHNEDLWLLRRLP
ncbi:hypothetical protein RQP54_15170 [Curvibacter sp. APW13]|uniref:hypothetical protein n=1 Tax=Curvibacter sp. APW13 TaxID=3077236 RepID=UPI0028DF15EB|nr:hypothetical protein [Curvibacter sp. APW13]MDT8992212.1 hypothetical protein [Curvibacter sp. APW13]